MKCPICSRTVFVTTEKGWWGNKGPIKILDAVYCSKCHFKFMSCFLPEPYYFLNKEPFWKKKKKINTCQTCLRYEPAKRKCKYNYTMSHKFCDQYEVNSVFISKIKDKTIKSEDVVCPGCSGRGFHMEWNDDAQREFYNPCDTCKGKKTIKILVT